MKMHQIKNKEQNIPINTNIEDFNSLDESLKQQLVDIKVEIFLNKSAQYLRSTGENLKANFI
ncbi:MAG: hypothetical protein OQL19_11175 [Gammaproteobacteria bacterium]|nr:hypothetical protein [Gammaproteobacteria bacterium]